MLTSSFLDAWFNKDRKFWKVIESSFSSSFQKPIDYEHSIQSSKLALVVPIQDVPVWQFIQIYIPRHGLLRKLNLEEINQELYQEHCQFY